MKKHIRLILLLSIACSSLVSCTNREITIPEPDDSPRIINIVNFIRQCEPRIEWITEDVLYETVVSQIEIMDEYNLPGTFLLQYDALVDPRHQDLLKNLSPDLYEIGAWWEITQPHN